MFTYQSLVFKVHGASHDLLNARATVENTLRSIARQAGLHVVDSVTHLFSPQGISAALLLSESHVAMHTWPEEGGGYITLTTCKPVDEQNAEQMEESIRTAFHATKVTKKTVNV